MNKRYLVTEKQINRAVNYWIAHGDMDAEKMIAQLSKSPVKLLDRKEVEGIIYKLCKADPLYADEIEKAIDLILNLIPPLADEDRIREIIVKVENKYDFISILEDVSKKLIDHREELIFQLSKPIKEER